MLVISRRMGESLRIAGEIRLTILRVEGGRVRVGIEAPSHVGIVRDELEPLSVTGGTFSEDAYVIPVGPRQAELNSHGIANRRDFNWPPQDA
jgi:carbon storage regulator